MKMNNKQLAEMIKRLRKDRIDTMTDMNTTSNMKGAGHDIVEYRNAAGNTSDQMAKTPQRRASAVDRRNQPKAGNDTRGRYVPHIATEEKTEEVTKTATKSKKNKDVINTSPEQDSAMIGTQ
jgi:hypothetical protein